MLGKSLGSGGGGGGRGGGGKRVSPQVLEQFVEVQFACLLGLISGKEERSWQEFKTRVRKKVVVLIREERKSLKLKCIGETVSASMSK